MRQLIAETESLLQNAIAQVRKAVYAMREQAEINLSWQLRWRKICLIFAECTGVRIRASIPDDLGFVDDRVGDTVARILQEALNNAIRHGNASYVHVAVLNRGRTEERTLLVKISDNGRGAEVVKPSLGLDGIRERGERSGRECRLAYQARAGFRCRRGVAVRRRGQRGAAGPDRWLSRSGSSSPTTSRSFSRDCACSWS